ncbi:MAG: RNA polymerase sigma factor [Rhodoferax sp.]
MASTHDLPEHIPSLRRYARALTGDAWAADDLVQDTLERACSRWRLWLAGSNLRAWLFSIMHNLYVDQHRAACRNPLAQGEVLEDMDERAHASTPTPELGLDLQRCLMRLPDTQREVLLLVCLEDMPYAEVARVTGAPIGTVMSRLSRARQRLHALMQAPQATAAPVAAAGAAPQPPGRSAHLQRLK